MASRRQGRTVTVTKSVTVLQDGCAMPACTVFRLGGSLFPFPLPPSHSAATSHTRTALPPNVYAALLHFGHLAGTGCLSNSEQVVITRPAGCGNRLSRAR